MISAQPLRAKPIEPIIALMEVSTITKYPEEKMRIRMLHLRMLAQASFLLLSCQTSFAQVEIEAVRRDPSLPPPGMSGKALEDWAPLGLPRLRPSVPLGEASALPRSAFEVDKLDKIDPNSGSLKTRENISYISLNPGGKWEKKARSRTKEGSYVSLQIYASVGTLVDIQGVEMSVVAGVSSNYVTLHYFDRERGGWEPTGIHLPLDSYDGRAMAALPILTFHFRSENDSWELFVSSGKRIAGSLERNEDQADKIRIAGGAEGALVAGIVSCDINPLFDDVNSQIEHLGDNNASGRHAPKFRAMLYEQILPDRFR